jgi:dTDP-glucose 4,6-dehydratase
MKLLVTGGCGFIGSNFVRFLLRERPRWRIRVLDLLTYSGNLENLADLVEQGRFDFVRGDISNPPTALTAAEGVDAIINFARFV